MEGPRLPPPMATAVSASEEESVHGDPPILSPYDESEETYLDLPKGVAHFRLPSLNILSPGSNPDLETYVVQFPKDQVYRVPPPENARHIASFRNTVRKKRPACNRCMCTFLALLLLASITGFVTLILHLVFNPTVPNFSISKITLDEAPKSSHKPTFDIDLEVKNTNSKMGVQYYGKAGEVSLRYKNKKLGKAEFPRLSQDPKGSDNVKVKIQGSSRRALPRARQAITLVLKIDDVRAKFSAGGLRMKDKGISVECSVTLKRLGRKGKARILKERCEIDFIN